MKIVLVVCFTLSILTASAQKQNVTLPYADSLFGIQNWKEAASAYEFVVKNGTVAPITWNRLGFSYQNLSNYSKALTNYEKALAAKPPVPLEIIIQSRMGRVYSMMNNNDQAFIHLDKAITLGYNNLTELETHKELVNLRADKRYPEAWSRVQVNAYPCLGNAQARQFDFWIGEWDAYVSGTNNLAGHSKIERASGGCMILENWTSAGTPFSGKSMNFVDPVSQKWKQVWVGSNGINASEFINGEYRDGAMRFECDSTSLQGVKTLIHFYFFNQGPDQMRQFHETSNDGGKTWATTYDFTYKRIKP
jgi:Tetratricopeptide repeat